MVFEREILSMAIAEGLPYFVMAAVLIAVLLTKVRTKWERVAAAAMAGTLLVGGIDATIGESGSELILVVMILGFGVAILSIAVEHLNKTPY